MSKGAPNLLVYDSKNDLINFSKIKENTKTLVVLKFIGLKFLKQQVICEWVPIQMKSFQAFAPKKNVYLIKDNLLTDDESDASKRIIIEKVGASDTTNLPINEVEIGDESRENDSSEITIEQIENEILPDTARKAISSVSDSSEMDSESPAAEEPPTADEAEEPGRS